jgi:hypothetical protein
MPGTGFAAVLTSLAAAGAYRIPRSAFVTIAPLLDLRGGTAEEIMLRLANGEAKYFWGWTGDLSGPHSMR